jgi:hypothetical protein
LNRRKFITSTALATIASDPVLWAREDREPISVRAGELRLNLPWGGWSISARDLSINGMTIPKFAASWVAANIATGIASAAGGFLFNMLVSALGLGGPTLQDLLRRQLEAIQQIVRAEIRANEIRRSMALFESIQQKMAEYMRAPRSIDRLENATSDSSDVFAALKSLGFPTYFQTLSAGSMHLAVLQERFKRDAMEEANYREFVEVVAKYHKDASLTIAREASWEGQAFHKLSQEDQVTLGRVFGPERIFDLFSLRAALTRLHQLMPSLVIDKPILDYYRVQDIDRIAKNSPEMRQLVVANYNYMARIAGSPLLPQLPPTFEPGRTPINYDPGLWGFSYSYVANKLDDPGDTIEAKYIDWPKFGRRVRNSTIPVGDKIVSDLRASIPQLQRLRSGRAR